MNSNSTNVIIYFSNRYIRKLISEWLLVYLQATKISIDSSKGQVQRKQQNL